MVVLGVALQARAATPVVIESWETGANGWAASPENAAWSIAGNSATGATDGTQSLQLSGNAPLSYGQLFFSPLSVANTTLLGNGASLSIDVFNDDIGQFGFFQQWTASVNQPGGGGYDSLDGFSYSQTGATGQKTLTWAIPALIANDLLSNPALPTSIHFQVGSGGDTGTVRSIFVDNVRIEPVPEPAMLGLAPLVLMGLARRRK
jgi:hypothetical protein